VELALISPSIIPILVVHLCFPKHFSPLHVHPFHIPFRARRNSSAQPKCVHETFNTDTRFGTFHIYLLIVVTYNDKENTAEQSNQVTTSTEATQDGKY